MKKKRSRINKKQSEKELSTEERNAVYLKVFGDCKHEKGYLTNTDGPSRCVTCGKPWI